MNNTRTDPQDWSGRQEAEVVSAVPLALCVPFLLRASVSSSGKSPTCLLCGKHRGSMGPALCKLGAAQRGGAPVTCWCHTAGGDSGAVQIWQFHRWKLQAWLPRSSAPAMEPCLCLRFPCEGGGSS